MLEAAALIFVLTIAFDTICHHALSWRERVTDANYREAIDAQTEQIKTLSAQVETLEDETAQSFGSGFSTGRVIYGGDTEEHEPVRPRGVAPHLRAVTPDDFPTAS